jgi:iron(III) transport system ATP-binding protein
MMALSRNDPSPLAEPELQPLPRAAPRPEAGGALRVEHLAHAFDGRRILEDISLAIEPGEVHCLVGPSGCGKTTTLRLIAGLEMLQEGRILVGDRVVAEPGRCLPPERRRIGMMFQDFALFPHLRVVDNVAFGLGGSARERRRRALELLVQVGMAEHAQSYPYTLSGGEQQRVALARALAPRPALMLLDEPFSSLDAGLRERVRDEVMAILRHAGTPVLMVTHDAEEAVRIGDRIHVIEHGRLLQSGTATDLYCRPAHPFVAGFFGMCNRFKGWAVGGQVSTPFGDLAAPHLENGAAVDVFVRPEAVRLRADGAGRLRLRVTAVRDLGPARLVTLRFPDGPLVTVRERGRLALAVGEEVAADLDRDHVFVYPLVR